MFNKIKKRIVRPFGILTSVSRDEHGNLYITNEKNHRLEMRASCWSTEIPAIEIKCTQHIGQFVHIATSQTTNNWSELIYFCDVTTDPTLK